MMASWKHNINIFKMVEDVNEAVIVRKDQRSNTLKNEYRNDKWIYRN